jgi:hypothetical protein
LWIISLVQCVKINIINKPLHYTNYSGKYYVSRFVEPWPKVQCISNSLLKGLWNCRLHIVCGNELYMEVPLQMRYSYKVCTVIKVKTIVWVVTLYTFGVRDFGRTCCQHIWRSSSTSKKQRQSGSSKILVTAYQSTEPFQRCTED